MEFFLHIVIMLCIYGILVISTNLTVGMADLLSLCQAAFYGIGAYIGTFLLIKFNLPFLVMAMIVMTITGLTSFIISLASIRLKEDYFTLATLGFQMVVFTILYNWIDITKGPYGISGIPGIKLFGKLQVNGIFGYFVIALLLLVLVILIFSRLQKSPYGRLLKAIRNDELSVQALGRNTSTAKANAFFISSSFTALAGVIYAAYIGYISPVSFTLDASIFIITALFIGGIGTRISGPLAGAAVVVILPELLRYIGLPGATAANIRQIIFGLVLIILMFFRPQGLFGDTKMK